MKKKRIILVLGLCVLGMGLAVVFWPTEKEPAYRGRSLSQLVDQESEALWHGEGLLQFAEGKTDRVPNHGNELLAVLGALDPIPPWKASAKIHLGCQQTFSGLGGKNFPLDTWG